MRDKLVVVLVVRRRPGEGGRAAGQGTKSCTPSIISVGRGLATTTTSE